MRTGPKGGRGRGVHSYIETLEERRLLSYGIDNLFGPTHTGYASVPPNGVAASDVVGLPDGRMYVAASGYGGFGISRVTFDGDLDPTFGINGQVVTTINSVYDQVNALALQADGKLLAGGSRFDLVRYNADGSLDESFAYGGVASADPDPTAQNTGTISQVLVQPDGKILAIGTRNNGNHDRIGMVRYNPDGTLDTTFGNGGRVITDVGTLIGAQLGSASIFGHAMLLPDGKLLVSGGVSWYSDGKAVMIRYNADGSLDTTFANNGVAYPTGFTNAYGFAPAPGGGYYVLLTRFTGLGQGALSKWTDAGTIDTSFGNNGYLPLPVVGPRGGDVIVQPDGSIATSVSYDDISNGGTGQGWYLFVFSSDGQQTLYSDRENLQPYGSGGAMILQADGRAVVAGGHASYPDTRPYGALLYRYRTLPDPSKGARLEGSILTVVGDDTANTVSVTGDGTNWSITLDGVTQSFPVSAVTRVDFRMLGGNDTVTTCEGLPVGNVDLGDGNDTVTINGASAHLLYGGAGTDTYVLPPRAGVAGGNLGILADAADTLLLSGTPQADTFNLTSTTIDEFGRHITYTGLTQINLDAGDGDDTISLNAPAGPSVTVLGGDGNDTITTVGGGPTAVPDVIIGGAGDDHLTATVGAGTVSFEADAGTNALDVNGTGGDDQLTLADNRIDATTVGVTAGYSLLLPDVATGIGAIHVDGGAGNDRFTLTRTAAGLPPMTLTGGTGGDTVVASGAALLAATNVSFQGGGDTNDTANLTDTSGGSNTYDLSATAAKVNGAGTIQLGGLWGLTFHTGTGGSQLVNLDGTGLSSVTLVGGLGDDTVNLSGSPVALRYTAGGGHDTINITAGTTETFATDLGSGQSVALNVATGGSATFTTNQHLAGLGLHGGNAAVTSTLATLTLTGALTIDGGATLDIGGGKLVLTTLTTSPSTLRGYLLAGYDGGKWDGTNGITSSIVKAHPTHDAIGYAVAGEKNVVPTIAAGTILVRPTLFGDTNLDTKVDNSDVSAMIAAGHYLDGTTDNTWASGDWNYDGKVDNYDVSQLIASGNYLSGSSYSATGAAAGPAVSEPAAVAENTTPAANETPTSTESAARASTGDAAPAPAAQAVTPPAVTAAADTGPTTVATITEPQPVSSSAPAPTLAPTPLQQSGLRPAQPLDVSTPSQAGSHRHHRGSSHRVAAVATASVTAHARRGAVVTAPFSVVPLAAPAVATAHGLITPAASVQPSRAAAVFATDANRRRRSVLG